MGKRLSLEERVTGVCRLASRAKRHFEVWRVYSSPESRQRLWDPLEAYADFVNLDEPRFAGDGYACSGNASRAVSP